MLIKDTDEFKKNVDMGLIGENWVRWLLDQCGHMIKYNGYRAGMGYINDLDNAKILYHRKISSGNIGKNQINQGKKEIHRSHDLECDLCHLKVEVRTKSRWNIAMSSDMECYNEKTWIFFPIVKNEQVRHLYIVRIKDLRRYKDNAEIRKNRAGENYYKWLVSRIPHLSIDCTTIEQGKAVEILKAYGFGCLP